MQHGFAIGFGAARRGRAPALAISLLAAVLAPPALAAPDLTVTKVTASTGLSAPGAKLKVGDSVTARRGPVRASATLYFLSLDRRRDRSDTRLAGTRKVPALRQRGRSAGNARVVVPRSARDGAYYLIACADGVGRIRELNERNNCRASSARVVPIVGSARPRAVAVQTDGARASAQLVTAAGGGTLAAVGADGTRYELTVPAKALLDDTTITMTPVTSVGGLGGTAKHAAGVQLGPEGLPLVRPATLTITPAKPIPVARQIGFAWHGSGTESHLYPPSPDPRAIEFKLFHFSGYEVIDGRPKDRQAARDRLPTNVQDRLGEVEAATAAVRASGGKDAAANRRLEDAVEAFHTLMYEAVVKPKLDAAAKDDTLAVDAIQTGLAWARQVQLRGLDKENGARADRVGEQIARILSNAFDKSFERCTKERKVAFAHRMLSLARQAELAGVVVDTDKVQRCARFELDFTSTVREDGANFVVDLTTEVKGLELSGFAVPGAPGPAKQREYPSWAWRNPDHPECAYSRAPFQNAAPARVTQFDLDADLREVIGPDGRASFQTPTPKIQLRFDPGYVTEVGHESCPDGLGGTVEANSDFQSFANLWWTFHAGELIGAVPVTEALIANWQVLEGDIYARKDYERAGFGPPGGITPAHLSEKTSFALRHVPS